MSVILEWHHGESNSIIIADTVIEEKTFDTEGNAVEGNFWCSGCDYIQRPEVFNEVQLAIRSCNSSV